MESETSLEQQLVLILADSNLSPHLKAQTLLDLGVQLIDDFRNSNDTDLKLRFAINCLDHSLKLTPNGGTRVRNNLAIALYLRFQEHEDLTDFERSLSLHEEALRFFVDDPESCDAEEHLPGYVDKGTTLNHIANRLEKRFDMTGQEDYLLSAIKLHEESLLLHPPGHEQRARSLDNLADALSKKYDAFGLEGDLDAAINLHREALEIEPLGDARRVTLNQLGNKLRTRYEKLDDDADLDSSIRFLKECLSLYSPNHKDRKAALSNLAATLMRRFQRRGDLQDSSDAIALFEEALSFVPPGHPIRRFLLLNMAASLTLRFNACEDKYDLDKAIDLYEEALTLPTLNHMDRVVPLYDLANRLITKHKNFGDINSVYRAVECVTEALDLLPTGHVKRAQYLGKLAEILTVRFQTIGQEEDITRGITLHEEALSLLAPDDSGRAELLHNLSIELALRFETLGKEDDLNMAISKIEEVLLLRPEGHHSRGRSLSVLGRLLLLRFDMLGYREDLNNSVEVSCESLSLHRNGDSDREASLTNLANALTTTYEVFEIAQNLNVAIILHEEALSLQPPGHWNRTISLNNLAGCLSQRFSASGDIDDLEAALKLQEEAYHTEREQRTSQTSSLNYARILHEKYRKFHNPKDLDLVISTYQEALLTAFKDSPFRAQCMLNLGIALVSRFESSVNDPDEMEVIIRLFEDLSSMTTQFGIACRGSRIWATFADKYNHPSAAHAYRVAIDLMPLLVPATFDKNSRTRILLDVDHEFVAKAVAQAIHYTRSCGEAIELLEAGRNLFWSQAVQSSPDFNRLVLVAPDLAKQLQTCAGEITKSEKYTDNHIPMLAMNARSVLSLKASQDKWNLTLEQIRGIPGFEEFLRPLGIHRLKEAKSRRIIVALNATVSGCDALIMASDVDDVIHVPLPDLDSVILVGIAEVMKWTFGSENKGGREINIKMDASFSEMVELKLPFLHPRYGKKFVSKSEETSLTFLLPPLLDYLWRNIVLPIVTALNLKKSSKPPRLWWCPSGPFTFLPIHAAGSYRDGSNIAIESLSDYVISSYTTTLAALVGDPPSKSDVSKFTLLGVADTKNLPRTQEEIQRLRKYVPSECTVELGTSGHPPASVAEVCSQMESASVVHFACHGRQVQDDPLKSGLQLEDGNYLTMDKVMQLSIPNASLAFLSACETATGSEKLPDEALHVGSSLIFAGFKSVIATMWKIEDEDGPVIADAFYRNLFEHVDFESLQSNRFDATKSAAALHNAIKEMQECGIPPHRWVPFIHIGK